MLTDPQQLPDLEKALRLYPDELFAAQCDYPKLYLDKWDQGTKRKRLTGVAAAVAVPAGPGWPVPALALLGPASEPVPCSLSTEELLNLLKQPTCLSAARRVVLDRQEGFLAALSPSSAFLAVLASGDVAGRKAFWLELRAIDALDYLDDAVVLPSLKSDMSIASAIAWYPASLGCR